MAAWGNVTDVQEFKRLDRRGDVSVWYRYTVQTKGGIIFTKEVHESEATPEKLKKLLGERAKELDATKKL